MSYKEFKRKFKNIPEDKIKQIYDKNKKYRFNEWLSQYDVDYINDVGLEIMYKIFDAMDEEDK